jgi:hypothetical protein
MSAYGSAPLTARITATEDLINTNTVGHVIGDTRGRACPALGSKVLAEPHPRGERFEQVEIAGIDLRLR